MLPIDGLEAPGRDADLVLGRAVRGFASLLVANASLPAAQARAAFLAVCEFATWGWSLGLPLQKEQLFDRAVLNFYRQTGCDSLPLRARETRLVLLESVRRAPLAPRPRLAPSRQDRHKPYSDDELFGMLSWARAQPTLDRRRNAHALIALSVGAGLTAGEIIGLRAGDIDRRGSRVTIEVHGSRPRRIPVRSDYALIVPSAPSDPACYFFRPQRTREYPNAITNFTHRAPDPHPQVQRLRATWIVTMLNSGAPIAVILQAAGLDHPGALAAFLPYAALPSERQRHDFLEHPKADREGLA